MVKTLIASLLLLFAGAATAQIIVVPFGGDKRFMLDSHCVVWQENTFDMTKVKKKYVARRAACASESAKQQNDEWILEMEIREKTNRKKYQQLLNWRDFIERYDIETDSLSPSVQ